MEIRDNDMILLPNETQLFEIYSTTDFSGKWEKIIAAGDPNTAKSKNGLSSTGSVCLINNRKQAYFYSELLETHPIYEFDEENKEKGHFSEIYSKGAFIIILKQPIHLRNSKSIQD